MTILSTAQIEHGFPILAELDLTKLFEAFILLKAELPEDALKPDAPEGAILKAVTGSPQLLRLVLPLIQTMGGIGNSRLLRRISAVVRASDDDLIEAERHPEKMQEMESGAAKRPYLDTLKDLILFFSRLGLSTTVSLPSLEEETEQGTPEAAGSMDDSLSDD